MALDDKDAPGGSPKNLKARVSEELTALRKKGLAKSRRSMIKDDSAVFMTPEQAKQYLIKLKKASNQVIKPTPPAHLKSTDLNDWYSQQRQNLKQTRKKTEEAKALLRGYKATYVERKTTTASPHRSSSNGKSKVEVDLDEESISGVLDEVNKFERDLASIDAQLMEDEDANIKLDEEEDAAKAEDTMDTNNTDLTEKESHESDDKKDEIETSGEEKKDDSENDSVKSGVEREMEAEDTVDDEPVVDNKETNKDAAPSEDKTETNKDATPSEEMIESPKESDTGVHNEVTEEKRAQEPDLCVENEPPSKDAETENIEEKEINDAVCEDNTDNKQTLNDALEVKEEVKDVEIPGTSSVEDVMEEITTDTIESDEPKPSNKFQSDNLTEDHTKASNHEETRSDAEVDKCEHQNDIASTPESMTETEVETGNEPMTDPVTEEMTKTVTSDTDIPVGEEWRNVISKDSKFPPESNRYHLYVAHACPWAHRTVIVRNLKGLQDAVGVTYVHPTWQFTKPGVDDHRGWVFGSSDENTLPLSNTAGMGSFPANWGEEDCHMNAKSIREIYEISEDKTGKYILPVLWDNKLKTIVSNESSEIIRMLNFEFDEFAKNSDLNLYPEKLQKEIDAINKWVYPSLNNGVYKCGLANTQESYDKAIDELTESFDKVTSILEKQRYLAGNTFTEADVRLFVTLIRYDEVYDVYFKTNTRSVATTPALLNYVRDVYQMEGVTESCRMDMIKAHYFTSHVELNKYSIIPRGDNFLGLLNLPHGRELMDE